ncbi:MAG: hypothetical protein JSS34_06620 [Proteobacteria bacterium]|nr:hypothetical protein [Pseudomonadota bacterium]
MNIIKKLNCLSKLFTLGAFIASLSILTSLGFAYNLPNLNDALPTLESNIERVKAKQFADYVEAGDNANMQAVKILKDLLANTPYLEIHEMGRAQYGDDIITAYQNVIEEIEIAGTRLTSVIHRKIWDHYNSDAPADWALFFLRDHNFLRVHP